MTQTKDLIERIRTSSLEGKQQIIAAYLTSDLQQSVFLSSHEIAVKCEVSTSAVTRLAQKLGYAGFPELKKDLEVLYRKKTSPLESFESFSKKAESESIVSATVNQEVENLRNLLVSTPKERLNEVARLLQRADRIYLVAIGSSEILVDHLAALLTVFGKTPIKLKSFGVSKQCELIRFDEGDVVVGFSFQRILREVRDVLLQAKKQGARTVAITDSETNPLSLAAEQSLVASVVGQAVGLSLTAPLALVNLIGNAVAASDKPKSQRLLGRVKQDWDTHPIFCDS